MTFEQSDTVFCSVEPSQVTVKQGEPVEVYQIMDTRGFPENCPRGFNYDKSDKVGCFACTQARGVNHDGTVETALDTVVELT